MSILIKGMEMPKTGEYRCVIRQWKRGEPLTMDLYGEEELCGTIIPVPPHGRLGDLGKLAKVVLNWITTQEKAYPNEDSNALSWRLGARAMGHQIYRDIEAAPTIIEAEEGET